MFFPEPDPTMEPFPCLECARKICKQAETFCNFCHSYVVQVMSIPLADVMSSADEHGVFKTYTEPGETIDKIVLDRLNKAHLMVTRRHVH